MTRRKLASPRQRTTSPSGPAEVAQRPVDVITLPPRSVAVREVLDFPLRWLLDLPLPSGLLCSFAHGGGRVALCTAPSVSLPDDPAVAAFVGPELLALTLAAEHERANAAVLRTWIARKPAWRLTALEAVAGLGYRAEVRHWTVEQVLQQLGLALDEVWTNHIDEVWS